MVFSQNSAVHKEVVTIQKHFAILIDNNKKNQTYIIRGCSQASLILRVHQKIKGYLKV